MQHECADYDVAVVSANLEALQRSRRQRDVRSMMFLLRSGLTRNLGGMGADRLFRRCWVGTKHLIECYNDECVI